MRSSASRQHWEHQQRHMRTDTCLQEHTEAEKREPSPTRARKSSKADRRAPRSHCRSATQGKEHPETSQRQKVRSSKKTASIGAERSKHTSRPSTSPTMTHGGERRSRSATSPYFDYTRHNVPRAWSRWRDARASVQVRDLFLHGVSVLWLPKATPPHSTTAFRAKDYHKTRTPS